MINTIEEKIAKVIANAVDYNIYCLAKYHRNNFYNFCREHNIKDYKNKRKEVINEYEKIEFEKVKIVSMDSYIL